MPKSIKKDLLFIFWTSACAFLFLSLLSFSPYDPSFNSIGQEFTKIKNFCGLLGSFLSDTLYQFFGIGAWLVLILFLRCAWRSFNQEKVIKNNLLPSFFIINTCSLLNLYGPQIYLFEKQIPLGGVLGAFVVKHLIPLVSFYGLSIMLWAIFIALITFYTKISIFQWIFATKALTSLKEAFKTCFKILIFFWFLLFEKTLSFFKTSFHKLKSMKPRRKKVGEILEVNFSQNQEALHLKEKNKQEVNTTEMNTEFLKEENPQSEKNLRFSLSKKETYHLKSSFQKEQKAHLSSWLLPPLSLLEAPSSLKKPIHQKNIEKKAQLLKHKLSQFKVEGKITAVKSGPAITLFEFKPNSDVKISRITELADDLCLALSCESVRILAPIPGRDVVGIETSNDCRQTVGLRECIEQDLFWSNEVKLPLCLGKRAEGTPTIVDLSKIPHTLIAGTTGSGKSVFVVSCLISLIYKHSPKTLKLILIDPKQVDLSVFQKLPHLLMPVLKTPKKAITALKWAVDEMNRRYRSMATFEMRDLESFNKKVKSLSPSERQKHNKINEELSSKEKYYFEPQPLIVILVEEFGDLMAVDKGQVEPLVVRLAQMARACSIHLILAMQSPRKDVVTGLIKTNIPGRISFKVASSLDSRVILDEGGAERLLARGDMLYMAPSVNRPQRHHGAWVSEEELSGVLKHWFTQGEPEFVESFPSFQKKSSEASYSSQGLCLEDDDKCEELMALLATEKYISASLIQRRLSLGYPRAARLVELLEEKGLIGPSHGSKPRKVLNH